MNLDLNMNAIFNKLKTLAICLSVGSVVAEIEKMEAQEVEVTEKLVIDLINDLMAALSTKNRRTMQFSDRTRRVLSKEFIIMFRKDETIDGDPTIILNDFDMGFKAERNPVVCMELVYDDVDVRNEDFDTLLLMKN